VKSKLSNKPTTVQQAFIRFSGNGLEATFAAQLISDKYSLILNMRDAGSKLLYRSGDYKVELIVGDAFIDNSFVRDLGVAVLSFPPSSQLPIVENVYVAKPEIAHKFREPEPRPSKTTSFAFTCLVLSPCAILVLGVSHDVSFIFIWNLVLIFVCNSFAKILVVGLDIKLPGGTGFIYSVIFLGFVVGIFALYALFWLQLNMFQTLQYLLPLAVGATIFGNLALRARAAKRGKPKQA
jgi:oligosaccharyltransferase complex subunit delta (ribophorin II)